MWVQASASVAFSVELSVLARFASRCRNSSPSWVVRDGEGRREEVRGREEQGEGRVEGRGVRTREI